jgi:hypothetical protein
MSSTPVAPCLSRDVGPPDMSLEWSKLMELREEIPAAKLGVSLEQPVSALSLVGENPQSNRAFIMRVWFKIGPQQYIRVSHGELQGFAWAPSDGAFAYFLTGDSFFDDGASEVGRATFFL